MPTIGEAILKSRVYIDRANAIRDLNPDANNVPHPYPDEAPHTDQRLWNAMTRYVEEAILEREGYPTFSANSASEELIDLYTKYKVPNNQALENDVKALDAIVQSIKPQPVRRR